MGFVEYEEAQIREMYNIFVAVAQQLRNDSYELKKMPIKEQELLVRLY